MGVSLGGALRDFGFVSALLVGVSALGSDECCAMV
jgi:hypothetical protein